MEREITEQEISPERESVVMEYVILPAVTDADNGKVWGVKNGEWCKSDDLLELADDLAALENDQYITEAIPVTSNLMKRELRDDGTYIVNNSMMTKRYAVNAGDEFKVVSDYKFQFQTDNSIPTDGTTTRVGDTFGKGTYIVTAPEGATYLIVCTFAEQSESAVYSFARKNEIPTASADNNGCAMTINGGKWGIGENVTALAGSVRSLEDDLYITSPATVAGNVLKRVLGWDGLYSTNNAYLVKKYAVNAGAKLKIVSDVRWQFQSDDSTPTSGSTTRVGATYGVGSCVIAVPENATYLMLCTKSSGSTAAVYNAGDRIADEIAGVDARADKIDPIPTRMARLKTRGKQHVAARSSVAPAEYYVGADREYPTINDALEAWAEDGYPAAVVYIANGEYNEVVYVEDHTISFIGESREGTIIRTKTGVYNDAPFRIHHGNVFVANLTAIADHSSNPSMVLDDDTLYGYAFHIDGGSVGGIVHVKNCKAISYQAPAFGMGTIPGATIRLEDVEAYCYTPSYATKTKNNDCILCHLSSTTTYPDQEGDETLELINVDAYAEETPQVILLKASGNPKKLGLLAINTTLAKGYATGGIVSGIDVATLDERSIGNSSDLLNN